MRRLKILLISAVIVLALVSAVPICFYFVLGLIGWLWLILGTTIGTVLAFGVWIALVYFWWAPNNLYFTFVREGTAKAIVKGHEFYKVILRFKGYTLDEDGNVFPEDTWIKDGLPLDVVEELGADGHLKVWVRADSGKRSKKEITGAVKIPLIRKSWFERLFGGLCFYGAWPVIDVFTYLFEWVGVKIDGKLEHHPQKKLDCIMVKDDVYGCSIVNAEDKELMPLNIDLALTARIVNPHKALFVVENWFELMINRVRTFVRDFVTTDTYAKFTKETTEIERGVYKRLKERGILDEFRDRYGIDLRKIEVVNLDPADEKRFREVTMQEVIARREQDAILVRADAERQRLEKVAAGERKRIELEYDQVQQFGDLGKLIRTLEAMEKSPAEGSRWVVPLPGFASFLGQVFPGESTGSIDPGQIAGLIGQLEELKKSMEANSTKSSPASDEEAIGEQ